ncbi:MAG: hypothetical protein DRI39_06715 [Chloroflexi bacterium]|nr:MAG: hypothetical protein DRI39_06715 [Chloroflexota bacterium]
MTGRGMRVSFQCRPCLENLVYQAAELSTPDPQTRARAVDAALALLHRTFSYDRVAPDIATACHRAIKKVTGNQDIYHNMKIAEMEMAERLFREVRRYYGEDLRSLVRLATAGNAIDFFKDAETVSADIRKPVEFTIDHIHQLEARLADARLVLYLADNAGECFFDLPLLSKMRQLTRVVYVVKGMPVQNDLTLEDVHRAGLLEQVGEVTTTGSDAVGTHLPSCSEEFRARFHMADLVFAKGMGNYETLSELPAQGKVFHCLMAKCQPIADSIGVPVGSYVAMLR